MDDETDKQPRYAHIPIPSYDEAISSRPSSSQNLRNPQEISDNGERQGLLGQEYRQPTVESPRTSEDSDEDLRLPEVTGDDIERRQVEELDYLDPSAPDTSRRSPRLYHRSRIRSKWSQHLSNLSATFSAIRLPSFRSLYTPVDTPRPTPPPSTLTYLTRLSQRVYIPEQYRMSAPTFARLCGLFALVGLIYVLFAMDVFPGNRGLQGGAHYDPEAVRVFVQENVIPENIEAYLAHLTSFDHVAGTEGDLYLVNWMKERWQEEGGFDSVAMLPYWVYLNYPGERGVEIVKPDEKRWTARLEEDTVYSDRQQTLAWHGYGRSGEVEGPLIYVNGGSKEDFALLAEQGIFTNGSIALVKYGGTQPDRAMKVKAAEDACCIGVLIYSDPSDVTSDSAWQPPEDMLQRGSVGLSSFVLGDPLTPGFASTLEANRESVDNNPGLSNIPSLPLSWRDAKVLIDSLQNHGVRAPYHWIHGRKTDGMLEWWTGNATSSDPNQPIIHLTNQNEENPLQQIWNLHGLIEGLETPENKVFVGSHHDAWCFGAVDAGSASAVMMEVIRIFGELRKRGWRPLRSIEFVSWDAEEYNFVGSTEYVEDNIEPLQHHGVAYLNVDSGVWGPDFRAAGSPMWEKALMHVLDRVVDPSSPDNAPATTTLKQLWEPRGSQFEGLGAGSDYVAFQDIAGTSSIDFGFVSGNGEDAEHYPYHSCYETLEWMSTYGDPGFRHHALLAQVWALLILEVADRPLLPFDIRVYAKKLHEYIPILEREAAGMYAEMNRLQHASFSDLESGTNFTLQPIRDAADVLAAQADEFHRFEDVWTANVLGAGGLETQQFTLQRLDYNNRLAKFETDLLDLEKTEQCKEGGLPGRCQFKHTVFGPRLDDGYGVGYFPGVRDAVGKGDWEGARWMVERVAGRIRAAAGNLAN